MRLIRGNVEREASGYQAEQLKREGYRPLEKETACPEPENCTVEELEGMTLEELKKTAKEKGLKGYSSLTKEELKDILKG